jgi:hypothetical protein
MEDKIFISANMFHTNEDTLLNQGTKQCLENMFERNETLKLSAVCQDARNKPAYICNLYLEKGE